MTPKTPEQARAFLKSLGLLNKTRVIEGTEREKTLTMLRLMPSKVSNNQHLWCETWKIDNVTYELYSGYKDVDELIEVIEDDIG